MDSNFISTPPVYALFSAILLTSLLALADKANAAYSVSQVGSLCVFLVTCCAAIIAVYLLFKPFLDLDESLGE